MGKAGITAAIIGLGHIGRVHIQALRESSDYALVAACDRQVDLASLLPESTVFYDSHIEMLQTETFDVVIVATPNSTHNAIACDVLKAGCNVIVEKPAAANMAELHALEQLAKEQGKHVYYAFHAACALEVSFLREHLRLSGEKYGPLTGFFSRFYDPYIDASGAVETGAQSLDDCWTDSGVNALSVLDAVIPVELFRLESSRQSGHSGEASGVRSVSVRFDFPVDGAGSSGLGVIDTAWDQGMNYKCTELYYGRSGWKLVVDHSAQTLVGHSPDGETVILVQYTGERLLNHYRGVFSDYSVRLESGEMNGDRSLYIHGKLHEVVLK